MSKSDLLISVEKWLKEQGYPLEMRVAQFFLHHAWLLHHSRRYNDPITGKEREIDILAFNDDSANNSRFHGRLVIECKWTSKRPWVLFDSSRSITSYGYLRSSAMNKTATKKIDNLFKQGFLSHDLSDGFPLFSSYKECYTVVQALRKSNTNDVAYSAVESAVNAADFFADQSSEHCFIYIPTVIIDGELCQCNLNEKGDISVHEIDIGLLIHHRSDYPRCVYIVRESGLTRFVDFVDTTLNSIRAVLKKAESGISKKNK